MALLDYGLTPEYINRRWTEELLALIFISRVRRIKRHTRENDEPEFALVSEETLFKEVGFEPEVVQRGNKSG